ncbi:hypothetical protein OG824_01450 [Streptomyces prunicolor]|uniref:hypothetical protein n=1 Tax=Streptomyces prunicolor TaxID=67348 RepID=UPI002256AC01|nr:hypothetical protein [Streptomyces prunicolor]MCX5233902.1 hypothetical protein [Streptomyces prunicolor]
MSSDIVRLAARVAVLERQLARTTRTARMAYSSVEDGAIEVYDQDGTLRGSMGLQDDGTVGFVAHNGPPPPTPTPPVVESALSGLTVTWPGTWTDAETAPLDLAEVQVHLSTTADAKPDTTSPVAAFHTATGGSITLATDTYTTLWVRLIAVNTSGTAGEPSTTVQGQARKAVPDDLVNAIIDETKLARGAVTDAALALGAVNTTALADGAVLAEKLAANSVTLGKVASGAVTADALAADSVIAGKVAADAITGREIAANSVTANEIAAASISTDKLVVVGGTNVLSDPSFEGAYTAAIATTVWSVVSGGNGSAKALRVDATATAATTRSLNLTSMPIMSGEQLYLAIDANASADWTGGALKFYARWLDGTGATVGFGVAQVDVPARGTWQRLAATVTAPANTTAAAVWVETYQSTAGAVLWDNAVVRPVIPGVQIADGAITAPKILAGAVTAEKIAALAITAEKIAGLSITTDKLSALSVTADKIAANSVTATKISAGAIEATHIKAGAITADKLDADAINGKTINGAVLTGGTLQTAASGQRVVISPGNTNPETGSIEFYSGSADESAPAELNTAIGYASDSSGTYEVPSVSLSAPKVTGSSQETGVFLQSHVPGYSGGVFNLYANELSGNGVAYINGYGADTSAAGSSIELHVRDAPSVSAQATAKLTSSGFAIDRDLSVYGKSQGRGFVAQKTLTANVTFSSTETALITTGSITFKAGRAYRVSFWALHSAASDSYALYRIRKNTVSGTIYKDQMRINNLQSSTANAAVSVQTILTNTTGGDVTAALCWTGVQGGVAQTWTLAANSSNIAYLLVEDCGSVDDYIGQAIT